MANDRSYLAMLQDYYARHRALPSYASIGQLLGLKSKSSVAAMVARLKLRGFIESTPDRRLAPTGRFFARPLALSPVQAGEPNPVDDGDDDVATLGGCRFLDDYEIPFENPGVLHRVALDADQHRL